MPRAKRLRVFAGPNGSGKSTLYKQISSQFNTGYFVNSDEIEQEISKAGFINLSRINYLDDKQKNDSLDTEKNGNYSRYKKGVVFLSVDNLGGYASNGTEGTQR